MKIAEPFLDRNLGILFPGINGPWQVGCTTLIIAHTEHGLLKSTGGGGATPRFWTPTTPPTNCWPEAPWGGGGGGGLEGGFREGRMGGGLGGAGGGGLREGWWGGGVPSGAIWGGGGGGGVQVGRFGVLGGGGERGGTPYPYLPLPSL